MTNLDSILKSRDVTLPTKVRLVKAMVFPVVMYGCESWTIKKAEHRRIAFELWCWRRLLRVCKEIQPVNPKRNNQYWIFIGWTDAEAETPILWPPDVKNWHIWKRPWCWERLKVGAEGDDRGWDGWMASLTRWTCVWVGSGSWGWTGKPGMLLGVAWYCKELDTTEQLNWTDCWKKNFTKAIAGRKNYKLILVMLKNLRSRNFLGGSGVKTPHSISDQGAKILHATLHGQNICVCVCVCSVIHHVQLFAAP